MPNLNLLERDSFSSALGENSLIRLGEQTSGDPTISKRDSVAGTVHNFTKKYFSYRIPICYTCSSKLSDFQSIRKY